MLAISRRNNSLHVFSGNVGGAHVRVLFFPGGLAWEAAA
jgi:hypothetical protein